MDEKFLYILAIPVFIATHLCTKGHDGELILFFLFFAALSLSYLALLLAFCKKRFTWHSFGHLALFEIAAILGFGNELDESGTSLYFFIPSAVFIFTGVGMFAMFITNSFLRKRTL